MRDKLKARALDVLTLLVAAGVLLAGLYLYGTIRRHHQLVDGLIQLIQSQQQSVPAPAEIP